MPNTKGFIRRPDTEKRSQVLDKIWFRITLHVVAYCLRQDDRRNGVFTCGCPRSPLRAANKW